MVKEERLRGAVLDACPHCDEEKKWYSQHWARSADCQHPDLSDDQHAAIQGLLLGDGSIEGNPDGNAKVRIETAKRPFAAWIYDQLGWLASALDRHSRPDGGDQYRVSTLAHPECNRYRDWYRDGAKRLPDGYRFSPPVARAFYACDGSLNFGGRGAPHVEFRTPDPEYRQQLVAALSRSGYPTAESENRIRIPTANVDDWLDWIGDPVPGVEHKWCTDRERYRTARSSE